MATAPLSPSELRRRCDPAELDFETTAELEPLQTPLGQPRAVEATRFAMSVKHEGYNLFVLGPSGVGKHAVIGQLLDELARERSNGASDWCYVHDFDAPRAPRALRLPPGRGHDLATDMSHLVRELKVAIPAAFESDEYRNRRHEIEQGVTEQHTAALEKIEEEAEQAGLRLVRLPHGVAFAPVKDGEVLGPDEFRALPKEERETLAAAVETLQKRLSEQLRELPKQTRAARAAVDELNAEVAAFAVDHIVDEVEHRWSDHPEVVEYLRAVRADVVEHASDFRGDDDGGEKSALAELAGDGAEARYSVNVLVDRRNSPGAPVVYEDRPSVSRLIGKVEHKALLGNLVSDLRLIQPGALHRANGGYLVLDAIKVLSQPQAWDALKRALFARTIRIESLTEILGLSSTVTLEPQPIPLDVKVVLVGERHLYHLVGLLDPDLDVLFRVIAEFDDRTQRSNEVGVQYARLLARTCREEGLRAFDRGAVASIIEHSSRLAEDTDKLSMNIRRISDLMIEADHAASELGSELVRAEHVNAALAARERRRDLLRERLRDETLNGTLMIATDGEAVGQINALSVLAMVGFSFGRPGRVTANVRVGDGKVIDVEREVELGGRLHSKGVLILSSYLSSRFARELPLSLSASLVFEQSYGGIDGDSASLAECCALTSALSRVPIKQCFAVTGSINQRGEVQAIGGVNEKIEGYFDLCAERGLDGTHGVLIPAANVRHLMLDQRVVQACERGLFHVWAVKTVDEAIALLTGQTAGEEDETGAFPEGSVNARVMEQLVEFATLGPSFSKLIEKQITEAEES